MNRTLAYTLFYSFEFLGFLVVGLYAKLIIPSFLFSLVCSIVWLVVYRNYFNLKDYEGQEIN